MKLSLFFLFTTLLLQGYVASAQPGQVAGTVSGYIKDAANGEALIGVSVYVRELAAGAVTNNYGFFSATVPTGTYTLSITYLGYQQQSRNVTLTDQPVRLNVDLAEAGKQLQEVVVSATRSDENVKSIAMSVNKIDLKTMRRIPALLGEVDVVRSIQLLPGVSTVGEGATGFNVRGGSIDQNLVLMDEAPVYNSSHLFGFFSIFNPDAVKDVKLIKGGIPANYGGRIASILDVRLKEGNAKKGELNGGIGLIFSRLSYERPLFRGKDGLARGSFIVAARRSYADILAQPFLNSELRGSAFNFYDLTAKVNYRINERNTVYASGYFGRDVFGADFGFNWGNATASARWNHVFSDKLFLNTTAYYTNYDYALDSDLKRKPENANDRFQLSGRIVDYSIKPDFSLYLGKHTITFGGQSILHDFRPGNATAASVGDTRSFGLSSKYALESAVYVGNEQRVSRKLQIQYGLRYSLFNYVGPGDAYTFTTSVPLGTSRFPVTSVQYKRGEVIQTYGNWEPRLSANYQLGANSSFKLSYNRLAQYVHLISNTTASTPLDVWTPSTNNVKPQLADQVATGFFKNFGQQTSSGSEFEASVEVYYKRLQNQIDYIDGARLVLNQFLEGDLLTGKGRAYGAELYLKRNRGVVNGWVSYTLARTERQVAGINGGNWLPTRFDKPHTLTTVLLIDPLSRKTGQTGRSNGPRWNFSATFTLASGTPATFPTNRFEVDDYVGQVVDGRNNYRIPPYHRLDIAATLQGRNRVGKRKDDNWVFSVYNVYARQNPFSVYFQANKDNPRLTEAVRYSVFATAIPSVTYNFKF